MKRIFLFVVTNLAVMLLLSVVMFVLQAVFGVRLSGNGMGSLLVMSAVFGFGGALVSLAMSKWTAKRMMGVQVIQTPRSETEHWLVNTVSRFANEAGIGMPEVGIFDSPDMNAFATGARRDAALVAVSSGLLAGMNRQQAEAVIGHEITHVSNGDMVTLTLIQGVVNTFVIFLSRIIGSIIDRAVFRNDSREGGLGFFVSTMVAQMVLGILASMIVMWFSRMREFRADAGGARLSGRSNMISALEALTRSHEGGPVPAQMQAFAINAGKGQGLMRLFMSHPPLEERIAALRAAQ